MKWQNANYIITDNREALDVEQTIEHSLCFGLFHDDRQIGFARAATARSIFACIPETDIGKNTLRVAKF